MRRFLRKFDARWSFFYGIPSKGRILELGCGRGENCRALHDLYPELEIHGVDLLDESEIPEFIAYRKLNLEAAPLPYSNNHFEAILFIHVIEHLREPFELGAEIFRVLKPGGTVYIETPNFTSIYVPSFGYRRNQHHPFNFWDDPGHQHPWTKQSLYEFLARNQLQTVKIKTARNWFRIPFDPVGMIYGLLTRNRPGIVRHFWNLYGWCIYAMGRKPITSDQEKQ